MKASKKVFIGVIVIMSIVISFFAGRYMAQVENTKSRNERCCTLICSAIDKAENGDLTDQETMGALISDVYAAYQFSDDTRLADKLHDLWSILVSGSDVETVKEIALIELNDALRAIKASG